MAVFTVNGEAIEEEAIRRETAAMLQLMTAQMPGENPSTLRTRAREWAEENLIEGALLRQAAWKDPEPLENPSGLSHEEELQKRMERLVERITSPASSPRHKDIVAFYVKNRESFNEPEKIRAAHIIRNVNEGNSEEAALAQIETAKAELAKGRPFAEVADKLSDCPGQGGDLGYFGRGNMVPAFEAVVFNLEINEVSGIFRTEFGFHIATVLDRRPAGVRKLEEVHQQIEELVLREKKQKRLNQYVDNLRAGAVILKESVTAGR